SREKFLNPQSWTYLPLAFIVYQSPFPVPKKDREMMIACFGYRYHSHRIQKDPVPFHNSSKLTVDVLQHNTVLYCFSVLAGVFDIRFVGHRLDQHMFLAIMRIEKVLSYVSNLINDRIHDIVSFTIDESKTCGLL